MPVLYSHGYRSQQLLGRLSCARWSSWIIALLMIEYTCLRDQARACALPIK